MMRKEHLQEDLIKSDYTVDLYKQYRKHLGWVRYKLLFESQKLVVPKHAKQLLNMGEFSGLTLILALYKLSRKIKMDWFLKSLVMPSAYKKQIKELEEKIRISEELTNNKKHERNVIDT